MNLFEGLISSKTRIKLIIRLFFNPQTRSYLRELAKEFDVSTNSVREELNQLKSNAGWLDTKGTVVWSEAGHRQTKESVVAAVQKAIG